MKHLIVLSFLALASGCAESSLDNDDRRLAQAYASLLTIFDEERAGIATPDDASHRSRADSVLQHYGFNREQFTTRLRTLATQPEAFREFHRIVAEQL